MSATAANARTARHTAHKEDPHMETNVPPASDADTVPAEIAAEDAEMENDTDADAAENAAAAAGETVTIKIAGLSITLPRKFAAGHVLTANQAAILDAAYQRQFKNNQNSNAENRAEAYAKAQTDAERAAKAPLTADQIAALYTDYEPHVGDSDGVSATDRLIQNARWAAWVELVREHNDSVASGGAPVIAQAGARPVALMKAPTKTKDVSKAAHKEALETFAQGKANFLERFGTMDVYAARIQRHIDRLLAEKGAAKAKTPAAVETVSAFDIL